MAKNSYSYIDNMNGKIIVFYGPDNQPGVTMVSKSCGEQLEKEGYNVLFLSADRNGTCSYSNITFQNCLEDTALLVQGCKDEKELFNTFNSQIISDGVTDMMPGLRNDFGRRNINEEFLPMMINQMKKIYDFIVIDGGTGSVEGLGKYALKNCNMLYIVTTQQEKSFERLFKILVEIKENYPGNEGNIKYVFNKFNESRVFPNLNETAELLGCHRESLFKIEYVPFGWQAEKEKKTLLWNRKFMRGIKSITGDILRGCMNEY